MTWCGKDPGDMRDGGTSEKQEPKPGPKGACVERREVPGLVGGGHRSCRLEVRLTALGSQEDNNSGKLRMVGVAFWSLSCSSAPPSPPCTHVLGLHLHLRPGTGCWASSLGPEVQTVQRLGRRLG